MKNNIISFSNDTYYVPFRYLFKRLTNYQIINRTIKDKTKEYINRNFDDNICTNFKNNLSKMIENLNNNSNILIQIGNNLNNNYYKEIEDSIFKDLGYIYNIYNTGINIKDIYTTIKKIKKKTCFIKILYYYVIFRIMINYIYKIDTYIKNNICFEINNNSFINLKKEMLSSFYYNKGLISLIKRYKIYKKKFKNIKLLKPTIPIKIGIIGNYNSNNCFIEKKLGEMNIQAKVFDTYNKYFIKKRKVKRKNYRFIKEYISYKYDYITTDIIFKTKYLIANNYDGIIYVKKDNSTTENNINIIINKICKDYNFKIISIHKDYLKDLKKFCSEIIEKKKNHITIVH